MPELRAARDADIPRLMMIRAAVRENRLRDLTIGADDYLPYVADGRCWVTEADGAIQGFAALDAEAASIWALFVDPAHEGSGLGGALLHHLVRDARNRGLEQLTLLTEAGTRAESFYRKAGWEIVDRDGRNMVRLAFSL